LNKIKYILLFITLIFFKVSYTQDIHFSQFNSSPLNLNPALTGSFDGNYRFAANFKNQWQSITVPYRTFSASLEKKITLKKNFFGIGFLVNADKAGDSEFGTTQGKLSFSYGRYLSNDSSFSASIGANISYNQNSINYNHLNFGSQYSNGQFDPGLSNNENFKNNSFYFIDYSAGINFNYLINHKLPLSFGAGFTHLNKPEQSFYEEQLSQLERKYNFHFTIELKVTESIHFIPGVVYYKQGKFQEIDYGGLFKSKLNSATFHNFYFGGWIRHKDAFIADICFDYQNMNIGISYDINTSKLRTASNGFGGIEISLIYIFYKKHVLNIPYIKQCPAFM